jgi:hypothetical protein
MVEEIHQLGDPMEIHPYGLHCGPLHNAHRRLPRPFNPLADANAERRYAATTASLQADDFYANHTREECRVEWARRYDEFKATTIPFRSAQEVYDGNS